MCVCVRILLIFLANNDTCMNGAAYGDVAHVSRGVKKTVILSTAGNRSCFTSKTEVYRQSIPKLPRKRIVSLSSHSYVPV